MDAPEPMQLEGDGADPESTTTTVDTLPPEILCCILRWAAEDAVHMRIACEFVCRRWCEAVRAVFSNPMGDPEGAVAPHAAFHGHIGVLLWARESG